jgi:hypothetical protein
MRKNMDLSIKNLLNYIDYLPSDLKDFFNSFIVDDFDENSKGSIINFDIIILYNLFNTEENSIISENAINYLLDYIILC